MNIKINSLSDRIRSGLINRNKLKNLQKFAQNEEMLLSSIPLKDGTTAKILANAIEYDCLIMKNGKVLTARGQSGPTEDVATGILGLFEHIKKRRRAEQDVNINKESFILIEEYLKKYGDLMPEI